MILGSDVEFKIGSVVNMGWYSNQIHHPKQPFFIRREATHQEWVDFVRSAEGPDVHIFCDFPHYYEVSTD